MGIKQAGKEILKGNFGNAFNQLIPHSDYRGNNQLPAKSNIPLDILIGGGDGVGAFYTWNGITSSLIAYDQCPQLKSVCNRRALATINTKLSVVNSLGKPSSNTQSKKSLSLLLNPNPMQTFTAFMAQIRVYLDLVGYVVIIPIRPVGYSIADSESLWVVPPTLCDLGTTGSNSLNFVTGGIDYVNIGGTRVSPQDVIIIQDIDPSINQMIKPASKVKSLEHVINNILGSLQSESNLIKQRGPSGIISGKVNPAIGAPIPMQEPEKERLQMQFNAAYGFLNGQSSIILTDAALDYHQTGFDMKQLGLHESVVQSTKTICDTIGYPAELLSITDSKYDNMQQADLNLYTKFIIPGANNIAQQLSFYLLGANDKFLFDYSHLPELQADKQKMATAAKTNTEHLIMQFKMNAISLATFKKFSELEDIKPGDELIYFENIKDIISIPVLNNVQTNQNGNQTN